MAIDGGWTNPYLPNDASPWPNIRSSEHLVTTTVTTTNNIETAFGGTVYIDTGRSNNPALDAGVLGIQADNVYPDWLTIRDDHLPDAKKKVSGGFLLPVDPVEFWAGVLLVAWYGVGLLKGAW